MAFTPSFFCACAAQTARADTALLLRRVPSPEGAAAARVPPGSLLFVLRRCGGWFLVRCGEAEGYASADQLVLHYSPHLPFFV